MSTPHTSGGAATPVHFLCPITQEIMADPVIDTDGNTYERAEIEEWVRAKGTSPLIPTSRLSVSDLRPNRSLQEAIQNFQQAGAGGGGAGNLVDGNLVDGNLVDGAATHAAAAGGGGATAAADWAPRMPVPEDGSAGGGIGVGLDARVEPNGDLLLRVAAKPADGERRTPTDVCMALDISGSMGTEAAMMHAGGAKETHGLSLLDVVKHGVTAVIETLIPDDHLTLVAYSSTASTVCTGLRMDPQGKAQARQLLKALKPTGRTNLWDGLETGLEHLRANGSAARLSTLLLLTDGQPNVVPPRGHLPMLRRYWDQHPEFQCVVSTFGFGYSLDSALLDDLAREGGGAYCFIPDSGFVGTAFVHAAANVLATAARHAELAIELPEGSTATVEAAGGQPCTRTSWGACIPIGALQFGQDREVLLRIKGLKPGDGEPVVHAAIATDDTKEQTDDHGFEIVQGVSVAAVPQLQGAGGGVQRRVAEIRATLKYQPVGCPADVRRHSDAILPLHTGTVSGWSVGNAEALEMAQFRTQTVDALRQVLELMKATVAAGNSAGQIYDQEAAAGKAILATVAAFGTQLLERGTLGREASEHVSGIIDDVTGQATEAISTKAYWMKWGQHYLPSLCRAHQLQQCNNFKDPGVQPYGGSLFRELRDAADSMFVKLPPPTPSCLAAATAASSRPVDMRMYHHSGGGCLAGSCIVTLVPPGGDGSFGNVLVRVDSLRKGDKVLGLGKTVSTVRCLVETGASSRPLVAFPGGLRLTNWHPVRTGEGAGWEFPATLAALAAGEDQATIALEPEPYTEPVYSFVLEDEFGNPASGLVVGGVEAIALAAGIKDDPVANHPFYGTDAVAQALALRDPAGWEAGFVQVPADCFVRDPDSTMDEIVIMATTPLMTAPMPLTMTKNQVNIEEARVAPAKVREEFEALGGTGSRL